ncbi:ABC transporter ATP-binding protein [Pseudomonas protegens]|uniref:ABC transporter ATP-binding protein n=1 Tax=Pseudomonas protegens TaxID=380021 RepID=UPI00227E7D56|nr:ABC transporter ATP-binding protein [Pseudomonas protegens]MCY7262266.1 ABC transporter ATP-binding protein [Pseudomonas protegens]
MSSIKIENLSIDFRRYKDRSPSLKDYVSSFFKGHQKEPYSEYRAVNNVSLEIFKGERVGIVGHNGAGKSTLLKALCRIYEPVEGTIRLQGRVAPLLEIGAGFHPEFTGRENIYLNGAILKYNKAELKRLEPEIIAFAEIEEFIDTPVKYYSTGMYLRLAFSLATAIQPEILILDEMFAGGDAAFIKKAKERMLQVVHQADVMILVSHDIEILRSLCTRIVWMDHGVVKDDGDPETVISRYLAKSEAN